MPSQITEPTQMSARDVVGIESPLLDMQIEVPEHVLSDLSLQKNTMQLIDEKTHSLLLEQLSQYPMHANMGGACANTLVTMAQLGSQTCFVGKIGTDKWGAVYQQSMQQTGIQCHLAVQEGQTGATVILITPDGARTMNTCLGVSQNLNVWDIPFDNIQQSRYLYLSAYMWDSPTQQEVANKAIQVANKAAIPVALNLSDPLCVKRHLAVLPDIITHSVQLILCNLTEAEALTNCHGLENAAMALLDRCPTVMITVGSEGVYIAHRPTEANRTARENNQVIKTHLPAKKVAVKDTTGAGDAFAGGLLHGTLRGMDWVEAAQLGIECASAVITQLGARMDAGNAADIRKRMKQ